MGAACMGLALGSAADGSAATRNVHALTCTPYSGQIGINAYAQVYNGSAASSAILLCAFDSDNSISAAGTPYYTLDGWSNGANGIQTQSCITYVGGNGGACDGTLIGSTQAGVGKVPLVTPYTWQGGAGHYPYLWVQLGQMVGGSANVMFGYTVTN
jgi:hypothetical protein